MSVHINAASHFYDNSQFTYEIMRKENMKLNPPLIGIAKTFHHPTLCHLQIGW